jgi:N-acyl-phosphatidylethanolamine-hydrolysing phospholipase D
MHRRLPHCFVAATLAAFAAGATAADAGEAARAAPTTPSQRGAAGFQNRYTSFEPKGLGALLRWRLLALRDGLPKPPRTPTPRVAADLAFVHANAAPSVMVPAVTWIGHATVLVQAGGLNLLTDPQFSERASPFSFIGPKRALPPGIALAELPHIDVVVISHNHYDHLDQASVVALSQQPGGSPLFLVPLGLKRWFADVGIGNVIELDWWQAHRLRDTEIVLTPVQHWSGRSLTDRMQTLWGGYAVFAPDLHAYFAGDTAYSADFADTQSRFASRQTAAEGGGFDVALIPIGAYEPRWFMQGQHVNPAEAVRIHRDLRAKRSIGIHWGTFELTDESLDAPPQALVEAGRAEGLAADEFSVLAVGETRRLPSRRRRRARRLPLSLLHRHARSRAMTKQHKTQRQPAPAKPDPAVSPAEDHEEALIDEASMESFPASDPISPRTDAERERDEARRRGRPS